jgi:hypothetical protein
MNYRSEEKRLKQGFDLEIDPHGAAQGELDRTLIHKPIA